MITECLQLVNGTAGHIAFVRLLECQLLNVVYNGSASVHTEGPLNSTG